VEETLESISAQIRVAAKRVLPRPRRSARLSWGQGRPAAGW